MLIGKRINDRYKILQLIGGGGMSNVYLAYDMILNREVAIKILRYDAANEEEFHRRFQREALSATSLTHPNIVSIYDVDEDDDMHYIVMEYVKGKTLKQYINEFSPLSPARSIHIMKQLTSAIAHAHENHIIHRDIKPQNVLVDQEGNLKVTDFGIATTSSATSYTKTNSVIGTVHYLSPEQARGGIATKKSDIYALGIVLYELLTGELPFSGESAVSIALKHLQAETPSVRAFDANIPQALENVVLKATAKNEAHRYDSVEEMQEDLDTVLSPSRSNEHKFMPPVDDDATKAIPIIKDRMPVNEIANTKVLASSTGKKPKDKSSTGKEKSEKTVKKRSRKKIAAIITATIAIIILLMILLFNLLSPKTIEIPDVANMEPEEAKETLEKAGFVIGKEREQNSDDVEEGLVIKTDPKAGLTRVEGTKINLIISIGNEEIEMDDYIGQGIDQVTTVLNNMDFKDIELEYEHSDQPAGTIIGQSPEAGEKVVAEDTTVTLTISEGVRYVTVPDLNGFNQTAISEYERNTGLNIEVSSEEHSDTVPAGSVISQDPHANAQVQEGGTVKVVLSKGPAPKQVKMYVNSIVIPYEPIELGVPQVVEIYIEDKNRRMSEPVETIEITEDYTYKIQLEIEEGQKAAYRIVRDSMEISKATISYDELKE
ncbi:serine/threonine-protein kinase [Lysinibacillus composti]|uniref:Serine/threonine-protein kinase PrkC n=1 Tax=Lysinibacillus composti TaxID=720633 RepID=A0A3N9UFQ1_9BACI|nr:Stk1 family PASTA domain-containing Ser/Thr kinase [Lysinibacillus composti]MBM7608310.1 serine/threonine-protein kinase [Lysinibacillus composti]RQW75009.1 Stk1 family PASTA domain-containing Ser/Thr kinase [Lysinibacillus composti]